MKRFVILIIAAVLLGGIIGGAFIGGITIGKNQGREEVTQEMQDRTGQFASRFEQSSTDDQQSGLTPPMGTSMPFGRGGTMGTVEKIEDGIITVTTPNGSVDVVTSDSTIIQKMDSGSLTDIKTGDSIAITGESNDDGTVQATSIFITSDIGASQ